MSYIYALYFVEQNAVKIGKANDLFTRLADLVSTWGNIDPYRAKAWELDELLVLGGEKQLHTEFQQYQKQMPEGDGSTEFFEPDVWDLLSDNFVPISKTRVIEKVNRTARQKPKDHTRITLNLFPEEAKQLSVLYGSNEGIKDALLHNLKVQLSDDKMKNLQELENAKTIVSLEREIIELKRLLAVSREQHQIARRGHISYKLGYAKMTKRYDAVDAQLKEFLNEPTDVQNKIVTRHILSVNQKLSEQNASLSGELHTVRRQRDYHVQEMTDARKHVRKARRLLKRAVTLLSPLKQTKPIRTLISEIEQFLIDIDLI